MAVKKQFLKSKPECKVTFSVAKEHAGEAENVFLVGDFNDWNKESHPMKKLKKDGSFSINLNLEVGNEYQFRYLVNGENWLNDEEADKYVTSPFGDSENSVLAL